MTALGVVWAYCRAVIGTRIDSERGASVVEYAFLVSLVAAACIGAMTMLGGATAAHLDSSASKIR